MKNPTFSVWFTRMTIWLKYCGKGWARKEAALAVKQKPPTANYQAEDNIGFDGSTAAKNIPYWASNTRLGIALVFLSALFFMYAFEPPHGNKSVVLFCVGSVFIGFGLYFSYFEKLPRWIDEESIQSAWRELREAQEEQVKSLSTFWFIATGSALLLDGFFFSTSILNYAAQKWLTPALVTPLAAVSSLLIAILLFEIVKFAALEGVKARVRALVRSLEESNPDAAELLKKHIGAALGHQYGHHYDSKSGFIFLIMTVVVMVCTSTLLRLLTTEESSNATYEFGPIVGSLVVSLILVVTVFILYKKMLSALFLGTNNEQNRKLVDEYPNEKTRAQYAENYVRKDVTNLSKNLGKFDTAFMNELKGKNISTSTFPKPAAKANDYIKH